LALHFAEEQALADADLVDFSTPPVAEVSMGIQFDPLASYTSLHAAGFWERIGDNYPLVEEHPPLDPTFETFGLGDSSTPNGKLRLVTQPLQPRFFFLTNDKNELVQFQRDRLHLNWRKLHHEAEYPRYPTLREKYGRVQTALCRWADDIGLGPVRPSQCEILYVNSIPLIDAHGRPCGLSEVVNWVSGLPGVTEDGTFQYRRRLLDSSDQPKARLSFDLRYGTDAEGNREARLILMVRGLSEKPTLDSCFDFFDQGRRIIVHTFTQVTSPNAHKLWGRSI
jgi:uncharacterized protein (TIGR04255 family)